MTFALINIPMIFYLSFVSPYYWEHQQKMTVLLGLFLLGMSNGLMLRTLAMDPGIIPKIVKFKLNVSIKIQNYEPDPDTTLIPQKNKYRF